MREVSDGPVVQTPHSKARAQARPRARGLDPTCQPKGHRQQLEMHMLQLRPGAATQVNMNKRERG